MSRRVEPAEELSPEERDVLVNLDLTGVLRYASDVLEIPLTESVVRRATTSKALASKRVGHARLYSRRAVRQWLTQWPIPGVETQ